MVREEIERAAAGGKLLHPGLSVVVFGGATRQQGGQAGNQARQILFIGPSMELGDENALSHNETVLCL